MTKEPKGLPGEGTPTTPSNIAAGLISCSLCLHDEYPEFAKWLQKAASGLCLDMGVFYRLIERIEQTDLIGISDDLSHLRPEIKQDREIIDREAQRQSVLTESLWGLRERFCLNQGNA